MPDVAIGTGGGLAIVGIAISSDGDGLPTRCAGMRLSTMLPGIHAVWAVISCCSCILIIPVLPKRVPAAVPKSLPFSASLHPA